ncbi:serine/threonine-protein kinase VRK1-like protein [Leptotrombidium deliense]|uniref:non-specific serine/threonine protein kinase n=1 Tax=Leptotrombidium deliense TaxID=299467 RepID=A0A443SVH8_9ACAR|nr:serine/threonine-protein kinase VRK1-like protein [Leptotrombidium deliense]
MSRIRKDNGVKTKISLPKKALNHTNAKKPLKDGVAPRFANNGYRLPDPLPTGEILLDNVKGKWIIGDCIGCGGFGEIYCAKRFTDNMKNGDSGWDYVVKVDNFSGPLFPEIHFYHRVAKEKEIESWMTKEGLKFLGIPRYIASGIHAKPEPEKKPRGRQKKIVQSDEEKLPKFRFLVMQRFGRDLQSILGTHKKFSIKTTFTLAIKIIDVLKFIHSFGYIHADIKASNLLLGIESAASKRTTRGCYKEVYLVDYGLVERYLTPEGNHRVYEEDQRRANNGTVEFTSRDAHIGALTRRSDLEILGYNVLSWLSGGKLPWMSNLKDHAYVKECKEYYMKKIHELVNYCFSKNDLKVDVKSSKPVSNSKSVVDRKKVSADVPYGVVEMLQYIANLESNEEPDYHLLKKILETGIEKAGEKYDGLFSFDASLKSPRRLSSKTNLLPAKDIEPPVAVKRSRSRTNNVTGNTLESPPKKAKSTQDDVKINDKKNTQRSRVKKPVSVPTTLTPTKTSTKSPNNHRSSFDNPTPAMIELLQKLKAKKLKK